MALLKISDHVRPEGSSISGNVTYKLLQLINACKGCQTTNIKEPKSENPKNQNKKPNQCRDLYTTGKQTFPEGRNALKRVIGDGPTIRPTEMPIESCTCDFKKS